MDTQKFNKTDVKILSAKDVSSDNLMDFYKKAFPERANFTMSMWKWINRSYILNDEIPHILVINEQVIAHAGMIPVNVTLSGKQISVSWFIDYAVLPEFQRQGLGVLLAKKWMEFGEIHIALSCSDMSLGAFRKMGWSETQDTYLHRNLIKPFNHPAVVKKLPLVVRNVLNTLFNPLLYLIYKRHSIKNPQSNIKKLDEKSLKVFIESYREAQKKKRIKKIVTPVRDQDFIKWRILDSPNKEKYYIYSIENFSAILLRNNNHGEYIDILWVSDNSQYSAIKKLIASLYFWGRGNNAAYIRFYTSNKELSDYLKKHTKSFVSNPRFAFFSKNNILLNQFKSVEWDWELIDNDFEKIL